MSQRSCAASDTYLAPWLITWGKGGRCERYGMVAVRMTGARCWRRAEHGWNTVGRGGVGCCGVNVDVSLHPMLTRCLVMMIPELVGAY